MSFLFYNKQIRKSLLIFIFVSIVFSSIPEKTNAQWVTFDVPTEVSSVGGTVAGGTTAMKSVKDIATYIADKFARAFTRAAIRGLTQSTVNWINNGFKGNPSFVTDPGQFFLDVADTSASQMLSETSLNKLCTPFKAQVRLALVKNYLQDNNNYSCTLSTLKNNYEAFTQDFSQGGWEGWFEMTQTSGGNPYSAYFAAQNQLAIQVGNQQIKYQKQMDLGTGFLNFEKCKPGTTYKEKAAAASYTPQGPGLQQDVCVTSDCSNSNATVPTPIADENGCDATDLQTVTPGSVIESQLQNALGTGVRQMELSSELAHGVDAIISATIDTLIAQLYTRVLGDTGLLDNKHGNPSDTSSPLEPAISTAPSITLLGSSPTYVQINTTYRDPGAMAFDYNGEDISASIVATGSVDTATLGTYTITYNVTNKGDMTNTPPRPPESSTMTRTVIVVNDTPTDPGGPSPTVKCTTDPTSGEMTCTLGPTNPGGTGTDPGTPDSEPDDLGAVCADVAAAINNVRPFTSKSQEADFLVEVAGRHDGWGVLSKTDGNKCTSSSYGDISCDILFDGRTCLIYDVIGASDIGGSNTPACIFAGAKKRSLWLGTGGWASATTPACVHVTPPAGTPSPTPTPTPTPPNADGTPKIDSISPTIAKPGTTTITINGSNLTNQVSFYDGGGGRTTVVGSVNSAKTQTTIVVPSSVPIGNATVKIYQGNQVWSNGILISISDSGGSGGSGGGTATVPSFNATSGWGGSLAYNSINNNWLVVSGGVNGRIMGNNGTPVTSEFTINTDSGIGSRDPKVAFAPALNKYLVIWIGFPTSSGGTIYGRFINADGTFSGNPFVIFTDSGGASYLWPNSILQYDSVNNKFVYAWEYRTPTIEVNLITVSPSGTPSSVVQVATGGTGNNQPSLAINGNGNEYCVAYDKRSDSPPGIAMKKINASTLAVGPETTLSNKARNSSIAYNSITNQYLVGWGDYVATTKGRVLKSCDINNVSGSTFTLNSIGETPSITYNPVSNTYAVIVQDQGEGGGNTYNILSSTGVKLNTGVAFAGGTGNFAPIISPNLTDGTFSAISSWQYVLTKFAPNLSR